MSRRTGGVTALVILALLAAACSGGGGGGAGPGGGVTVTLDTDHFTMRGDEGTSLSATVTASVSGQTSASIRVSAVDQGEAIAGAQVEVMETQARLWISSKSSLAPGTYAGTLAVNVCYDAGCSSPVRGSPFRLQYTVEVLPILKVAPDQVALSAVSGSPASASIAVQLPYGATSFRVSGLPSWLHVADETASGFTLAAASVPAGAYDAYLYVAAGGSQRSLRVTYTVTEAPGGRHDLSLDTSSLALTTTEGADASARVGVTPPSWNPPLTTSVSYGSGASGWLGVTPTDGGLDLRADAGALSQGSYTAWLYVRGDGFTTGRSVTVTLTVGPGLLKPQDQALTLTATSVPADLLGSVPVTMAGGPARAWTAATDAAWLTLDAGTGWTGTPLGFRVTPEALQSVENGSTQVATVRVAADPPSITPVQFKVTLSKRLPEVRSLGPGVILAGRAHRVLARGVGFDGLADVAAGITVEGLTGVGVTRVSDTEVALDVPAAPAGEYAISASNALGSPTAAAALHVVDAPTLAYARVQTSGRKRQLIYDPRHQALWASMPGVAVRVGYAGGAWTAASQAIADLRDLALTPDAGAVIAVSWSGKLRLLDPVTLTEQATYDRGGALGPASLRPDGVAVTNDGRVWLPFGDTGIDDLGFFDLARRTFSNTGLNFYEGPWLAVSGNGERLMVDGRTGRMHLDGADGTLKDGGFYFEGNFGIDEVGSRFVTVSYSEAALWDASFAFVGRLWLPDSYTKYTGGTTIAATVSPDGSRAYVLSYSIGSLDLPRVWVFDSTAAVSGDPPLLGYFQLPEYPTVRSGFTIQSREAVMAMTPDATTLFIAGDDAVMVVPVPSTLTAP
ncbi:NHL repeat-containing protein [Anaeromyxobacter soli]|uniref:hypothetical protein n=1 Tax=Anaeromyxobacter soli TaxID=2922725 RepID=UPI001FAF4BA3|nr:hypothetical protein [Anaeromyxobacter sp. SG29]